MPDTRDTTRDADGWDSLTLIATVLAGHQTLSMAGFALVNSDRFDQVSHAAARQLMTGSRAITEFRAAAQFLNAASRHRLAKPAPDRTTYAWSRFASRWTGVEISNGMFICAALALGWRVSPIRNAPNGLINLAASARCIAGDHRVPSRRLGLGMGARR